MNIVKYRNLFYAISLAIIIPGMIALFTHGLRLGIDFKGGQSMEIAGSATAEQITQAAKDNDLHDVTVTTSDQNLLLRYSDDAAPAEVESHRRALESQLRQYGSEQVRFESVGPSVSRDLTKNALIALALVSLAILLYISFAFRNMPPPVSSFAFGVAAIIALLHDALLLIGVFSILGIFFGVEIDSLFVTAVLTAIGFSVHDTIVVFDRVRENLRRHRGEFDNIVNISIQETLARSLNTSITVLLTLMALYLFGGESIKLFVLALLIGIASGTYSSIFNAASLLVTWNDYQQKQKVKQAKAKPKKA